MLKKVTSFIREHKLFSPGDTVIVAVSGGADSVALLDLLAGLKSLKLRLVVAHLNHCLRGEESNADEAFVRELAGHYQVSFVTLAVDVLQLSRQDKVSLEEAGRNARYHFFAEIAASCKAQSVAIAHHADDQAETVLMRLLRGSGGSGLRAMTAKTAGLFVRPLLAVTRREIESYLHKKKLSFRTDSSNADLKFLRNRIRHELIPFLRNYNPSITDRLVTTAVALSEDEEILAQIAAEAMKKHGSVKEGEISIDVAGAASELRGARMRLYRLALQKLKGDLANVSAKHLHDIDSLLLSAAPNGRLTLAAGIVVKRSYTELVFQIKGDTLADPYELDVTGPGQYSLAGGGLLSIEFVTPPASWAGIPATAAYFDGEALPFPWQVRNFRDGDSFSPLGMGRTKKIKDLFIDRKVPLHLRRRIPLFFSGNTLFWVGGVMPSATGRITGSTSVVLKAELHDFTA